LRDVVLTLALVAPPQSPVLPLDGLRRQPALIGQRRPSWRSGRKHLRQGACCLNVVWLRHSGAIALGKRPGRRRWVSEPASAVVGILRPPAYVRLSDRARVAANLGVDSAVEQQLERRLSAGGTGYQ